MKSETACTATKRGLALVSGTMLVASPAISSARDRGVNQPGAAGGVAGVGAPGVGIVDPGINQPGAVGNVGAGRDPGVNQPSEVGNRRARRY